MKTTIELLRDAARTTPRSQLDAAAVEVANRRGAPVDACKRFVALESRMDSRDGLPTAAELAEVPDLTREINIGTFAQMFSEWSILADFNREVGTNYATATDLARDVLDGTAAAEVLDDADVRSVMHIFRGGE